MLIVESLIQKKKKKKERLQTSIQRCSFASATLEKYSPLSRLLIKYLLQLVLLISSQKVQAT